jgi:ferric-dicitrate binding protein FerR (iron transport regulator)
VRPLALVAGGARVTVGAQDLAPAAPAPAVVPISAAEIATRLAWRVPRLELDDAPLREVVAAFNRGGGVRLVLAAPDLGELRVSGVVRADNAPALLQLLRVDHGVEAESRGEREFVLRVPRR